MTTKPAQTTISTTEARKGFSELCYRVQFGGETIVLTRRGKPVALLVPVPDAPNPPKP